MPNTIYSIGDRTETSGFTSTMEEFLKSFPFQLIVRGMLPGSLFVVSYFVARHDSVKGLQAIAKRDGITLASVAVLSGVLAYTVFRSAIYPLIEKLFDRHLTSDKYSAGNACRSSKSSNPNAPPEELNSLDAAKWSSLKTIWPQVKARCGNLISMKVLPYWKISDATCDSLIDHWTVNSKELHLEEQRKIVGMHNRTWNDYVHFQYVSVLCIIGGAAIGRWRTGWPFIGRFDLPLVILTSALAFSALVGDWRRREFMKYFFARQDRERPPTPK
jgi:hypothetical protein